MHPRMSIAGGALAVGLVLGGCSSGGSGQSSRSTTSTTSPSTTEAGTPGAAAVPTTAPVTTTASAAAERGPVCPTSAQAGAALGGSYAGPHQTATAGGGVVCEYTGGGGTAIVTIFAHQSATVFSGQVAHAPGAPAMPAISGVGDGAYGQDIGGRSIVNAYSNASRTLVAAQASVALTAVEALAKVALSDN